MRHPPRPSRRRFLAGTVTFAGATALAGCSAVSEALPNRATDVRTRRRGIPTVPPAVETTDAHLQALADEIADYASDGLEAWERIGERERSKRRVRVVYSDRKLENAAEFAESLDEGLVPDRGPSSTRGVASPGRYGRSNQPVSSFS